MAISLRSRSLALVGPHRGRQPERAFTLAELLLVTAMGAVVLLGAIMMLVSHIRSSNRLAVLLHLQDHCGWVQHLINREIEQAERAEGGNGSLELFFPGDTGTPTITYALNSVQRELRRQGPPIDVNGRLVTGVASRNDLVARDVTDFDVNVTNPRSPSYSITMEGPNNVTTTIDQDDGNTGGAFCRARDISGS